MEARRQSGFPVSQPSRPLLRRQHVPSFVPGSEEIMEKTHAHNGHQKSATFMPFDLGDARERLSDLADQTTEFIRTKPAAALFGALCLGFVLSRLVSRR
jgi:hypothetical protein